MTQEGNDADPPIIEYTEGMSTRAEQMGSCLQELMDRNQLIGVYGSPEKAKPGFLFADPSVWTGAGRLLDLGCTFDSYNYSRTSNEASRSLLVRSQCMPPFISW
jgi:hypothetical protein